jgi:hypothetical protein
MFFIDTADGYYNLDSIKKFSSWHTKNSTTKEYEFSRIEITLKDDNIVISKAEHVYKDLQNFIVQLIPAKNNLVYLEIWNDEEEGWGTWEQPLIAWGLTASGSIVPVTPNGAKTGHYWHSAYKDTSSDAHYIFGEEEIRTKQDFTTYFDLKYPKKPAVEK